MRSSTVYRRLVNLRIVSAGAGRTLERPNDRRNHCRYPPAIRKLGVQQRIVFVGPLPKDGVGIAIVPGSVCSDAPRDLECSPIGRIQALQLILAWRRRVSYRLQKMVAEIANELRRANLEIAS
jgi:DNA-binding transcriptional LysR family regulator